MAAPTNISALTATEISSLPATITQQVDDSGTTYTVWYKYTAPTSKVIGIWGYGEALGTGYQPEVKTYIERSGVQYSTSVWGYANQPLQLALDAGFTYYFEVIKNGNYTPSNLTLSVIDAPDEELPVGTICVNDDSEYSGSSAIGPLPVCCISSDDGSILGFKRNVPAGEWGDILSDGTLIASEYYDDALKILDKDYNIITTITWGDSYKIVRANQTTNKFWVADSDAGLTPGVDIKSYSSTGVVDDEFTMTGVTSTIAIATNQAETILYHTKNGTGLAVSRWDITNGIALSNFLPTGYMTGYTTWDIIVLKDDTILILYDKWGGQELIVKRFDSSANVLNTYNISTTTYHPAGTVSRMASAPDDPDSFWTWHHYTVWNEDAQDYDSKSVFTHIKVSDGTVLKQVETKEYEVGIYEQTYDYGTLEPLSRFGNSFSCFFWITRTGGVSTPGTIRVIKSAESTPSQSFAFTAGGGLTPGTFNLVHDGEQSFTQVPAGSGYSIVETAVSGFDTSYSVSNGSPNTNITVGSGEEVIITVTNTPLPAVGGIYKIVPNKREDTLWAVFNPETTLDVKIPDPYVRTALIGE